MCFYIRFNHIGKRKGFYFVNNGVKKGFSVTNCTSHDNIILKIQRLKILCMLFNAISNILLSRKSLPLYMSRNGGRDWYIAMA